MGCHRKASRNRLKHLVIPAAAMPALAGMAAAVCLAPQAQADPAPAHAAAQPAAATRTGTMSDALSQAGLSPAELFAAVRSFQQALGITVDGIVGPLTWRALVSGMLSS